MNESNFKCPNCGKQTFGVNANSKGANIICPVCLKNGITVVMVESKENNNNYMGDGLFTKGKKLNENKQLLNENA
jgi:transcription elongation factor Elf1